MAGRWSFASVAGAGSPAKHFCGIFRIGVGAKSIIEVTLGAPELSIWAMMVIRFAGLGLAGFHVRRSAVAVL